MMQIRQSCHFQQIRFSSFSFLVNLSYNFNIPNDPKDYVHRIGRTARAGKDGKVVNLLCDYDYDNFSKITHDYREFKIEKIKVPQIERIAMVKVAERRDDRRGGNYNRSGGFGRNRNNSRNFKRR